MRWNKCNAAKVSAAILAAALVVSEGGYTLLAAETPSEKEEVVYAILDSTGEVTGVYVVNSVSGGEVLDYGTYTSVKNLTSEDEISVEGDEITFHTDEEKVYYQGDLESKDIPWNISITYKMDGKEYTAEEIAGMSGALEISLSVTENEKCDSSFYDGFALQATMTLDGNKCKNITAEGATIANVGSDKQISYIVLPGKGMESSITADVIDFEMDAITINGTKLNLDIDMESSELGGKVDDVKTAVSDLNDGAGELDNGAKELDDGAKELDNGAKELDDGVKELNDGVLKLGDGVNSVNDGAVKLNDSVGTLNAGAEKIDTGASDLQSGAKSLKEGTVTVNSGAKEIKEGMASLNSGITQIDTALKELNKQSETLTTGSSDVLTALQTIQTSLGAVSMNTETLGQLSAASTEIKGGIGSLVSGLGAIDGGISAYYEGLTQAGISDMDTYLANHQNVIALLTQMNTGGQYTDVINLLTADAAYISASNTLISSIDQNLDSQGTLMAGAVSLQNNYETFDASIQGMTTTLSSLSTNLTELKSGIDTLVTSYSTLDTGITNYTGAVGQIVTGYKEVSEGAAKLKKATSDLYAGTGELVKGSKSLYEGSGTLKKGTAELLTGTGQLAGGTKELADGTSELKNGAADLTSGTTELAGGTKELKDGTKELTDGTTELKDGTRELKDGTEEFYDETKDLDTQISDGIDEMTGKGIEVKSFVSEKNTNVESVLFVMKTPAVEKAEVEEEPEEEEETTGVWQKFLDLFR